MNILARLKSEAVKMDDMVYDAYRFDFTLYFLTAKETETVTP